MRGKEQKLGFKSGKERGVEFEDYDMPGEKSPSGVITAGGAGTAWCKDSEGNIMAIIESMN